MCDNTVSTKLDDIMSTKLDIMSTKLDDIVNTVSGVDFKH